MPGLVRQPYRVGRADSLLDRAAYDINLCATCNEPRQNFTHEHHDHLSQGRARNDSVLQS